MSHVVILGGGTAGTIMANRLCRALSPSGAKLDACKASVDMFDLSRDDFIDELEDIITVGEFRQMAAGGQIIFT